MVTRVGSPAPKTPHDARSRNPVATQLRTEIEFWNDLIEARPPELEGGVMDMVTEARSLAERKLDLYLAENGHSIN